MKGYENAMKFLALKEGPFQPKNILYPVINGRKFREAWFTQYQWLEYSSALNAAFCFFCRAFYKPNKMDDAFTCKGYNNWKKAIEKFNSHQKTNQHLESSLKVEEFKKTLRVNCGSIAHKLDSQRSKIVTENRQYLSEILKTILYCAKQCIALRGHNESNESENQGNFIELLKIRSDDNNIIARYFLQKKKTFRYVSPDYQNIFINLMGQNVLNQIIENVKSAGVYSVIMDETQDLKKHEQVSIVLRYCDKQLNVFESFIGFYRTDKMDGESLSNLLKHRYSTNIRSKN